MDPLLRDFPEEFETERLLIRAPRCGDGVQVRAAIVDSIEHLRPWLEWAQTIPTAEEAESNVRAARVRFLAREDLRLLLFLKGTETLVGSSGLHSIRWSVPKFEIGYWVRKKFEGQGFISEAVVGITQFAFDVLGARRVEIYVDNRNERSWRIPERLGFTLEGIMKNAARNTAGGLRDTRVYAKVRNDDAPLRNDD